MNIQRQATFVGVLSEALRLRVLRAPLDFQNDLRQIHLRTKRNGGGIRWVHGGVGSGLQLQKRGIEFIQVACASTFKLVFPITCS